MFLGAKDSGDLSILGLPFDGGSTGRPGSRYAPGSIRKHSHLLEEFSPYLGRGLSSVSFTDLGDLGEFLRLGDLRASLREVFGLYPSKRWVFLGGDHSVTIPVIELLISRFPSLFVVYMDAHLDFRESYLKSPTSHASALKRIVDLVGKDSVVFMFGRSGDASEFKEMKNLGIHTLSWDVASSFEEALFLSGGRPVYLSIDLDLFDPAFLPGTGVPEPGGIIPKEFFQALPILSLFNIVAADVVELNPLLDLSGASSILAAKVVRELLLVMGGKDL